MFSTLFFGFLFRLIGLEHVSAWGDEVASYYYAHHLSEVFYFESHTPVYYFICRIWLWLTSDTLNSLRYFSVIVSAFFAVISSFFIVRKRGFGCGLLLLILWWLWPTEIIYSRQARHYAFMAEMMLFCLILWNYYSSSWRKTIWFLFFLLQSMHPFFILPIWTLVFFDYLKNKIPRSFAFFYIASSLPVLTYYLFRFLLLQREQILNNIGWIQNDFYSFLKSMFLLFVGDFYPLTHLYPLNPLISFFFIIFIFMLFLFQKSLKTLVLANINFLRTFIVCLVTVIVVELICLLLANVRVSRYFIYLVPFVLLSLIDLTIGFSKRKSFIVAGVLFAALSSYTYFILRPWRIYDWDDQNIANFKQFLQFRPKRPLVVCAPVFQVNYYFHQPFIPCGERVLELHNKKQSFHLFDINGSQSSMVYFLMSEAKLETYQKFNRSMFYSITYP